MMALDNLKNRLNYVQKNITAKNLIDAGYPVFLEHTPVKTGNAKRRTSKNSSQIIADYPYARRLDQGWSKQHPEGMVKPTITAMRNFVTKTLGK
jgi:hypothetical protein